MEEYTLKVKLDSPALTASGEGFGAIIDTDIVFDETGLPYIPAKRIKGCLRDSAIEVKDMFSDHSEINLSLNINKTFGDIGTKTSAPVYISNLYIEDYPKNKEWLNYFLQSDDYKAVLSKDRILETFTHIRRQTAIGEEGVAREHSLRTARVINKGTCFFGDIKTADKDDEIINTIALACLNFRRMGTMRNRGFGEIKCSLHDKKTGSEISITDKPEGLCIN
jgi:CRISPR-associated protein Csx10